MHLPRRLLIACLATVLPAFVPVAARAAEDPAAVADREALRLYFPDDMLVETATRVAKPVSQVAENVTVVTAREIEEMNAHTLAEVLNRVTGVFMEFYSGVHFGSIGLPHIQGSGETNSWSNGAQERHVTLLLDGVPWSAFGSAPDVSTIPLPIVDRIEIIKGPASSAWGSALGGVINVITKAAGKDARPKGSLSGSYGERDTHDVSGEVAGAVGPVGYFAAVQGQHADWNQAGADYSSASAFAKVRASLGPAATLTLSGLRSRPEWDLGHLQEVAVLQEKDNRALFGQLALDARLGESLSFYGEAHWLDLRQRDSGQEDGTYAPRGDLVVDSRFQTRDVGVQGRLTWVGRDHTAVLGVDYLKQTAEEDNDNGGYFQSIGQPPHFRTSQDIRRLGVYLNDTARFGPLTLTPGLRYDDASEGGNFWSPSLGGALALGRSVIVRAVVARGFTYPPSWFLQGGVSDYEANPHLNPERVWSYQLGVEASLPWVWLKVSGYRHDVLDTIEVAQVPGTSRYTWVNKGTSWRTGAEVEAQTAPWCGFSAKLGGAWVQIDKSGVDRTQDQYEANLGFAHRFGTWQAQLLGHYVWWDYGPGSKEAQGDDFLWDLTGSKGFSTWGETYTEVFASVHNLFNGRQMPENNWGTEGRWVEGGVRVRF